MASRFSRSVEVSHHMQLQHAHGTIPSSQLAAPSSPQQAFTPRMGSMRRGMTTSVASNMNV